MSIASNTGPLIALAKVDSLGLLAAIFGKVHVAPAVVSELMAKEGAELERIRLALTTFLTVKLDKEIPSLLEPLLRGLGPGEQYAIALASELKAPLLVDDRAARRVATHLRIPVTGTVGVLVEAKHRQLVPDVLPILHEIRNQGYWLSDALLISAAKLAGE